MALAAAASNLFVPVNIAGMTDKLLTANQVADILSVSMKTIRRLDYDSSSDRVFPRPVRLRSPSGGRPLKRWRLSDIASYANLKEE